MIVIFDEDIHWLEVSVTDALAVQVVDALKELLHDVYYGAFFKLLSVVAEVCLKSTIAHILHHDVDIAVIFNNLKYARNFWVIDFFNRRQFTSLKCLEYLVSVT